MGDDERSPDLDVELDVRLPSFARPVGRRTIRVGAEAPRTAMGTECAAHKHRELVPLEVHHVWPSGHGGPDTPGNRVKLCSNAHGAVHDLLSKMLKTPDGMVPWEIRRCYGKRVREIARRGYLQITAAR